MTQAARPTWIELAIFGILGIGSGFLFFMHSRPVPEQLYEAEGGVISRTPIRSKGKLTGFRFCLDKPRLALTYADPDPNVGDAWSEISNANRARVLYSQPSYGNPKLWGLTVNGHVLATPKQLYSLRLRHGLFWLAGALASFGYCGYVWRRARRQRSNNSSKPTPLRGAA